MISRHDTTDWRHDPNWHYTENGEFVLVLKLEVTEESKRIASTPTSAPSPDDNDSWDFELQRQTEMHILEEIENLEERISSASLQSKVSIELNRVMFDKYLCRFNFVFCFQI